MVINSLRAALFVAAGTVVVAGAAYVTGALDIFFPEERTAVASLPAPQTGPSQSAPAATAPQPAAPKVEEPAAPAAGQAASPQDAAPEVIIPSFDLVRVEPDGSLVVAGRAAPIATVEIVTGATTLGVGETNETGEFAIVLDDPLKPGDYTIVLRSRTRDAIVATSIETAIVSVPETENGQLLALVEQPGAPSRLITVPEPAAPKQDRPSAADRPAVEAAPTRPATEAEQPAETAASEPAEQKPAEQAAAAPIGADTGKQDGAAAPAQAVPVKPQESEAESQAEPQSKQQQIAAVPEPQLQEPAPIPAALPRIAVEAVEIEGSKVFVAGRAEAGLRVRVYANTMLLGDTMTSDGGRFLVEAQRDLPVGDYIVRADLLGRNGDVLARAAVPFEREPGEAVAAVAAEPRPVPAQTQAAPVQPAPMQPAPAQPAQTEAAPAQPAQTQPAQTQPAPAPPREAAAPEAADQRPAATQPSVAAAAPEPQGDAQADTDQLAGAPEAAQPALEPKQPEVTAPKLQSVAGAVIIRRGDTLWRISKRVYGRGVRYTTIYLANQEQIVDPDRIWPGQVFAVPDKTDSGEDADMSAVADRAPPERQTETR